MQSLESQVRTFAEHIRRLLHKALGDAELVHLQACGDKLVGLGIHFGIDAERNIGLQPFPGCK